MRNIVSSIANVAMIAGTVLFTVGMPAPSYAGYWNWKIDLPGWDSCKIRGDWHAHCKKTDTKLGVHNQSTGLFAGTCNGEVGFWNAIPMPNGKVFCVAQSTMDFYHNGTPDISTCTKAKVDYFHDKGDVDWQRTFDGVCKTHSKMD